MGWTKQESVGGVAFDSPVLVSNQPQEWKEREGKEWAERERERLPSLYNHQNAERESFFVHMCVCVCVCCTSCI